MTRKLTLAVLSLALLSAPLFSGCGSAPREVRKPDDMITTYALDIQDWDKAADGIRQDLLQSGKIQTANGQPAIIFVSNFENRTGDLTAPMHLLTQKIVKALTDSGKVEAMVDDPVARDLYRKQQILAGAETADAAYTLSGNITKLSARDGRDRQVTYIFHLNLNRSSTGTVAWMSEYQFTKAGSRAAVGF